MDSDISTTLSNLQPPDNEFFWIHYISGFITDDINTTKIRIFLDILSPRFYILAMKHDVVNLIRWTEDEMNNAGVLPTNQRKGKKLGLLSRL